MSSMSCSWLADAASSLMRQKSSKDAVSELTEELWEEYQRFSERDLSGYDVVYLFADGVFESLRQEAGMKEAIGIQRSQDFST